jgi:hypothetical protein
MLDLTPPSPELSYVGGAYPGTGGTCADMLAPGASCTLVISLVAPASGRQTSLVVLQYYDGLVYTTDTHEVVAEAVPGPFAPASHAPLPAMPQNGGQPPLAAVDFVTVSFADTPIDSSISAFGDWLVTSSYWSTVGKDYGVGPGTHHHVHLTDTTPHSVADPDIASYVDDKIAAGALPGGPQSVYTVFLSGAATVSDAPNAAGWHSRSPAGHAYAVILAGCSSDLSQIFAEYTFVSAHELIEAATDPSPPSGYDFGFGESEVADLCNQPLTQNGYTLPTIWSNSAAAQGGDPCVPSSGLPYIDADPSPARLTVASASGSSAVVTLTGWSTALVGDWLLEVSVSGQAAGSLKATLDPASTDLVNNGTSVKVTVTTDGSAPPGSSAVVQVTSFAPSGAVQSIQGIAFLPVTVTP